MTDADAEVVNSTADLFEGVVSDEEAAPVAHTGTTTTSGGRPRKKDAERFDPIAGVFLDKDGNPIEKPGATRPKLVLPHEFELDTRSVFDKDVSGVVTKDADGFHVGRAGKKSLKIKPREFFAKGAKFLVVGELARMEGMAHYGSNSNGKPLWSGYSLRLPIGTIVECIGWRRFGKRSGLVAPQFVYDGLPAEAKWSSVWPHDGLLRPWPLYGLLQPITDEQLEEYKANLANLAAAQEALNA